MKWLIPILLLLSSCTKHSYFKASEFNAKVASNPKYQWHQTIPEKYEGYNVTIDDVIDFNYNNANVTRYGPQFGGAIYVRAPFRDSVYELSVTPFKQIMKNEGRQDGSKMEYHFAFWSKNIPELIWTK